MITTLKQAKEITGGGITNKNSKMPEANYDLRKYLRRNNKLWLNMRHK